MNWKETCKKYGLTAPQEFWDEPEEKIDAIYNGIGPDHLPTGVADYLKELGVPEGYFDAICAFGREALNKLLTLFQPACVIHDFRFDRSDRTEAGFHAANKELLDNCKKILDATYPFWASILQPWTGNWKKRGEAWTAAELMYKACENYGMQAWLDDTKTTATNEVKA